MTNFVLIAISIVCIFLDRQCSRWQRASTERLEKAAVAAPHLPRCVHRWRVGGFFIRSLWRPQGRMCFFQMPLSKDEVLVLPL